MARGGLLARVYLASHRPARLGRVVMLGTPNQGSEIADLLKHYPAYRAWFDALPDKSRADLLARWGAPEDDPAGLRVTLEAGGRLESFTAAYVLGAGGAHSVTRHSMQEHLEGDTYDGRSVALADLFNRGVLDVLVANQNGPLLLYKNTVAPGRDWIQFDLEGTKRNRSAIGARMTLYWKNETRPEGQIQIQEVSGGNGYASQNMRRLHFGLGRDAKVEKIEIQWPTGTTEVQTVSSPEVNKVHRITEPMQ